MKKIKNLLILVLAIIFTGNVYAATATTSITGTNTVKVGNTTKIYIKLNASDLIEGVDVTYAASGNIQVTNAVIGSGLTQMGKNGNRYILYAQSPIKSGSTVLTLTVKGTKEGSGTITVSKMEATVSGGTVNGGTKSYNIKVNPAKTASEIKAEEEAAKNKEEERKAKEEANKKALEEAKKLVEAAEKSLNSEDYDAALKAVNALTDSDDKTKLVERLDKVKFDIEVNKAALNKCSNKEPNQTVCNNVDCKKWILLSVILFVGLLTETAYIIIRKNNK